MESETHNLATEEQGTRRDMPSQYSFLTESSVDEVTFEMNAHQKHLLYIDGDYAALVQFKLVFEKIGTSGVRLSTFDSGTAAVQNFKNALERVAIDDCLLLQDPIIRPVGLMVCDIDAPQMNGWDVLKEVKALCEAKQKELDLAMSKSEQDDEDGRERNVLAEIISQMDKEIKVQLPFFIFVTSRIIDE